MSTTMNQNQSVKTGVSTVLLAVGFISLFYGIASFFTTISFIFATPAQISISQFTSPIIGILTLGALTLLAGYVLLSDTI